MYEISGIVREAGTGLAVPGVVVSAFDQDLLRDDFLGEVMTGHDGTFRIEYPEKVFAKLLDKAPDVYLLVKTVSGKRLLTTADSVRIDAAKAERFELEIGSDALRAAAITPGSSPIAASPARLRNFTIPEWDELDDDLAKQIKADLQGRSSILEVVKSWAAELQGSADNDALPMRKLARLFELGTVPARLTGHYYGVAPGLRSGDLRGIAAEYGNLLGYIWSSAVAPACPWAGKSFAPMERGDRVQVIAGALPADVDVSRGINHFVEIPTSTLNVATTDLLSFMWNLKRVPEAEHLKYGHDRNGGHFAAYRAPSVHPGSPREVYRLSYRHPALDNAPPLAWLVDECVEIADGLVLGQVIFATRNLLERFDAAMPHANWGYQHYGYFVLFREDWNAEARRLFPQLGIPEAAVPGNQGVPRLPSLHLGRVPRKYVTLTLADPPDGRVDSGMLDAVRRDLEQCPTILDLLQQYSDELLEELDNDSPVFGRLAALFNAGIGPETMHGFYRGALVSWHTQGLLASFDLNTIDVAWKFAKSFSPWTGKRFDSVERARLAQLTDGFETLDVPTFFCANTVVFRTAKERFVRQAARLAGAWIEDATPEERRRYGYDAQTFFFIGKRAPSIHAPNGGKPVFQFNYRWPALRNPLPDRLCIDELVQIAEGLYLGQVFYATNLLEPWHPKTPLDQYDYRLFEYFIVMDEEWHARRLRIGFDLENT